MILRHIGSALAIPELSGDGEGSLPSRRAIRGITELVIQHLLDHRRFRYLSDGSYPLDDAGLLGCQIDHDLNHAPMMPSFRAVGT